MNPLNLEQLLSPESYYSWASTTVIKTVPPFPYDIYYTDKTINFDIPLAGVEKEDISIKAIDNLDIEITLAQNPTTKRDYSHKGIDPHFSELLIRLTAPIISEEITSTFKNGLLTVVCPMRLPIEREVPIV